MRERNCPAVEAVDREGAAQADDAPFTDRIAVYEPPGVGCRIHWAGRAFGESPRMVRMSMGNQDGGRPNLLQPAKPIGTAIDHEPTSAPLYEQGAVPAMSPRAPLDFATGTEKDQIKLFGHMLAAKQVCGSMLFLLRYQKRRDESVDNGGRS